MPTRRNFLALWLLPLALIAARASADEEYIFSAPPRETGESESEVYLPIAEYLSKATGKKIIYQASNNWLSYQDKMRKGAYDLVFDGPHFVSWRMARLQHVPLVKLAGDLAFVVIVRKDNDRINDLTSLAGRSVCGMAPPNLATLTFYNQFSNPVRQPLITERPSFAQAYQGVIDGKCIAAVMRDQVFNKLNKEKEAARVIFRSPGVPNQAFSASPRFTAEDRAKITEALLSPKAHGPLAQFFSRYSKDKDLVPATNAEFRDLQILLKDTWGFELTRDKPSR
jgi:ABC-type phosphate/phosphonate transport system substrate-binding protein